MLSIGIMCRTECSICCALVFPLSSYSCVSHSHSLSHMKTRTYLCKPVGSFFILCHQIEDYGVLRSDVKDKVGTRNHGTVAQNRSSAPKPPWQQPATSPLN